MSGRFLLLMSLAACAYACVPSESRDDDAAPPTRIHVTVSGLGAADVPVRGSFCGRDTTLAIAGASESWSAALAFRVHWPLAGEVRDTLAPRLGGPGGAAFAVRPLDDSVGGAYIATRGSATVAGDSLLTGSVEGTTGEDSAAHQLRATFSGVPVDTACP